MAEAQTLEDMLRPGERVLFGAPASWRPRHWDGLAAFACATVVSAVGGFAASGVLDFDPAMILGMTGGLVYFLIAFIGIALRGLSRHEIALTDQRLFYNPDHAKPKVTALELGEIQRAEIADFRLAVAGADGRRHLLAHGRDIRELGAALCQALGAPPPPAPGRRARLAQGLFTGVAAGAGLAAAMALFAAIIGAGGQRFDIWNVVLYLLAAPPVGMAVGLLASLPALAALRAVLTQAEMEGIVGAARVDFQQPGAADECGLVTRLYLGFVDLLYGGAAQPDAEVLGHGG